MNHLFFMELAAVTGPPRVKTAKELGLHWRKEGHPPQHTNSDFLSSIEQAKQGLVFCNGGSSMGNVKFSCPSILSTLGHNGIS